MYLIMHTTSTHALSSVLSVAARFLLLLQHRSGGTHCRATYCSLKGKCISYLRTDTSTPHAQWNDAGLCEHRSMAVGSDSLQTQKVKSLRIPVRAEPPAVVCATSAIWVAPMARHCRCTQNNPKHFVILVQHSNLLTTILGSGYYIYSGIKVDGEDLMHSGGDKAYRRQ
jgi:hypothetical protein